MLILIISFVLGILFCFQILFLIVIFDKIRLGYDQWNLLSGQKGKRFLDSFYNNSMFRYKHNGKNRI